MMMEAHLELACHNEEARNCMKTEPCLYSLFGKRRRVLKRQKVLFPFFSQMVWSTTCAPLCAKLTLKRQNF